MQEMSRTHKRFTNSACQILQPLYIQFICGYFFFQPTVSQQKRLKYTQLAINRTKVVNINTMLVKLTPAYVSDRFILPCGMDSYPFELVPQ